MNQRLVFCQKLQKEAPGLSNLPYPGPLGQRIFESICLEAWHLWLKHQTLLINENRLNVLDPKARTFLEQEMEKFFFEGTSQKPAGYKPLE
ncbi:MAG: oxidative damage protection protein [Proteobacteria bacterium]|nr:oxidative damage protection protein [Pseudomonadota bacterium]